MPRTITTKASTLVIQTVGRQQEATQPTPNAIQRKSLLHIFFIIVNTSFFVVFTIFYEKEF